jgi:hypothetical protein
MSANSPTLKPLAWASCFSFLMRAIVSSGAPAWTAFASVMAMYSRAMVSGTLPGPFQTAGRSWTVMAT